MINCNQINQVLNELLVKSKKCKPLSNEDRVKLIEVIQAIKNCGGSSEVDLVHNNTLNKQGGNPLLDEYYHLDKNTWEQLTSGNNNYYNGLYKKIIVDGDAYGQQLFDVENEGKFHLFIINHPSPSNPTPLNLKWQIGDEEFEYNSYIYDYIADALEESTPSRIDALSYGDDGEIHYWKGMEGGEATYPNVPENHILKVFFLLSNDEILVINPDQDLSNFIKKTKWEIYHDDGSTWVGDIIPKLSDTKSNFILNNDNIDSVLGGRYEDLQQNIYDSQEIFFYNNTNKTIPFIHLSNQVNVEIPFVFPDEKNFNLRPNRSVTFKFLKEGNLDEYDRDVLLCIKVNNDSNNNEVLEEDVFADVSVGSIDAGDTVAEGTTFTEFVQLLLNKTFYPTFTNGSISGNTGDAVEVGTSTKSITVNFTRGDIVGDLDSGVWNPALVQGNVLGPATKYWIDGVDKGASNSDTISKITTLGTNSVNIAVDYAEGDQPKDSKGNPYGSPEPSGTLNGVATWTGFYYRTAIAGNTAPTATDIRNSNTRRSNAGVINLPSGTTNVRFDVFVPQGSSITQVLDTGNLNLNITSEFVLQGSDFSGLDANGDEVLYKHYVRIIDNPYTVNSVLAITVT